MGAKDPSQEELQEAFEYIDGALWRKEYVDSRDHVRKRKLVKIVSNNGHGYCTVKFKGRMVSYHRIVHILINGPIPEGHHIDHKDGNPLNNDINNLTPKESRGNQQNQRKHREGSFPGVGWHKKSSKWRAYIRLGDKITHLGLFENRLEAFDTYIRAHQEHNLPFQHLLKLRAEYIERNAA